MVKINININNKAYSEEVEDNTLLVELLRDKLGLTGTHVGCDTSQCGACVIHVVRAVHEYSTLSTCASRGFYFTHRPAPTPTWWKRQRVH